MLALEIRCKGYCQILSLLLECHIKQEKGREEEEMTYYRCSCSLMHLQHKSDFVALNHLFGVLCV